MCLCASCCWGLNESSPGLLFCHFSGQNKIFRGKKVNKSHVYLQVQKLLDRKRKSGGRRGKLMLPIPANSPPVLFLLSFWFKDKKNAHTRREGRQVWEKGCRTESACRGNQHTLPPTHRLNCTNDLHVCQCSV